MNLGHLIQQLKKAEPTAKVEILLNGEYFSPGEFMSYRGYYHELALDTHPLSENVSVEEFLWAAQDCDGKEFAGYKGGSFKMNTDTPLWCSDYGEVSGMRFLSASSSPSKFTINTFFERD